MLLNIEKVDFAVNFAISAVLPYWYKLRTIHKFPLCASVDSNVVLIIMISVWQTIRVDQPKLATPQLIDVHQILKLAIYELNWLSLCPRGPLSTLYSTQLERQVTNGSSNADFYDGMLYGRSCWWSARYRHFWRPYMTAHCLFFRPIFVQQIIASSRHMGLGIQGLKLICQLPEQFWFENRFQWVSCWKHTIHFAYLPSNDRKKQVTITEASDKCLIPRKTLWIFCELLSNIIRCMKQIMLQLNSSCGSNLRILRYCNFAVINLHKLNGGWFFLLLYLW